MLLEGHTAHTSTLNSRKSRWRVCMPQTGKTWKLDNADNLSTYFYVCIYYDVPGITVRPLD